jgi:uncharacterized ubiquitin-like protein YukD
MKNEVQTNYRRYYMSEYDLYEVDHFVTFNIVDINMDRQEITVAVSNEGRISVCDFDLMSDNGRLFFFYGIMQQRIAVDDFEQMEDNDYEIC